MTVNMWNDVHDTRQILNVSTVDTFPFNYVTMNLDIKNKLDSFCQILFGFTKFGTTEKAVNVSFDLLCTKYGQISFHFLMWIQWEHCLRTFILFHPKQSYRVIDNGSSVNIIQSCREEHYFGDIYISYCIRNSPEATSAFHILLCTVIISMRSNIILLTIRPRPLLLRGCWTRWISWNM